jgi:pilus biogenesis lipoprotein CpaD
MKFNLLLNKININSQSLMVMIAISVLGVACGVPEGYQSPGQKNAVKTELVTFTLNINFKTNNGMAYVNDESLFREFLKEYNRRGRSELIISTTPLTGIKQEQSILSRIRSEGIGQSSIEIKRGKAPGKETIGALLSFKGYMISVPKCENWTAEPSSFNPNNLEPANFGCSYHRNIGLMLSDPGDLVTPRGFVETDARRMDTVLGIYRSGKAAGAAKPVTEAGKFAVSQQK